MSWAQVTRGWGWLRVAVALKVLHVWMPEHASPKTWRAVYDLAKAIQDDAANDRREALRGRL